MANGLDILAALQGTQGGAGSLGSLSNLQYRPVETGYGIAAQGVASALPSLVNPYGSNFGNFASVLGGALVSGLLGYQARKAADERNLAQSRALTELLGANVTAERQQALLQESPRLAPVMSQLALQRTLQERSAAQEQAKALREYQMKSALQKTEDLNIPFSQALAMEKAPATPATQQPEEVSFLGTKAETTIDGKRKNFQSKPIFNAVAVSEETIKRLAPAVFNEQAMTSRDFIVGAVQIIEPGMAVREGDEAAVKAAAGAVNLAQNKIRNVFDGKGELSLKDRAQIMDIVERAYNSRLETFDKQVEAAAVDTAKSINQRDPAIIEDLRKRLKGGLGNESYDKIVNRLTTVPGAKPPEDFDYAKTIREIAARKTTGDEVISNLRAQYGIEEPAQAAAAQQAPAEPKPLSDIAARVEATRNDPGKAYLVDFQQKRLSELLAKNKRVNLTAEERAEAQGILKFFGVR